MERPLLTHGALHERIDGELKHSIEMQTFKIILAVNESSESGIEGRSRARKIVYCSIN